MWGIKHCWGRSHGSWQVYLMRGEGGIEQKRTGCRWNDEWKRRGEHIKVKVKIKVGNTNFSQPPKHINCGSYWVRAKNHNPFSCFSPLHLPSPQSVASSSQSRLELVTGGLWHERANLYLTSHLPIDSHTLGDWRLHVGSHHHLSTMSAWLCTYCKDRKQATQCFLCSGQDKISALSWESGKKKKGFTSGTRECQHLIFTLCIGADDSAVWRRAAQGTIAVWQKEG